jgi:hypothetical protein
MRLHRRLAALACTLAAAALPALSALPALVGDSGWAVRIANREAVSFKGMPAQEEVGQPGTMMYPAPNVIGLVAGIVTHGLVAGAARGSARSEADKAADKLVDPYRAGLAGFTQQELALAALAKPALRTAHLAAAGEAGPGLVESSPVFYLTPEHDALVLDNSVAVARAAGEPQRTTIRVVSPPHLAEDAVARWSADNARALKAASAELLALSLEIAIAPPAPAGAAAPPYRTVRYLQGRKEMFERAQVLDEHCGRALIRSLRGWLMSVPLVKPSQPPAADCGA